MKIDMQNLNHTLMLAASAAISALAKDDTAKQLAHFDSGTQEFAAGNLKDADNKP